MKKLLLLPVAIILLQYVNAQNYIITTFAGNGTQGFSGSGGAATAAEFHFPTGICNDSVGSIYITDLLNDCVWVVDTAKTIKLFAGTGTGGYSGDGGAATSAELSQPTSVFATSAKGLYIADQLNHRIRLVNSIGIISTIAGTGTAGYSGDGGPASAAELNGPERVWVDSAGNIYIADRNNNRIRVINDLGVINTVAGNGTSGYSGDGSLATTAELSSPYGVCVDSKGNFYIADYNNNRVRMVNSVGTITTVAGNGTNGYSGNGGKATSAELSNPTDVFVDNLGNLYIDDAGNNVIRKVNSSGIISTIAGNGSFSYSGDGGAATSAALAAPIGICMDALNNIYITDRYNERVRILKPSPTGTMNTTITQNTIQLYPNPVENNLYINFPQHAGKSIICLYNCMGQMLLQCAYEIKDAITIPINTYPPGLYLLRIQMENGNVIEKKVEIVR